MDTLKELLDRAQREPLSAEECRLLLNLAESYVSLTQMLKDRGTTIDRLRKLVFGSPSEKTRDVLGTDPGLGPDAPAGAAGAADPQEPTPRPGHGRNGAAAYEGARRVAVAHASLRSGTRCPKCPKGKLYPLEPGVIVRVTGQAPVQASVWELEKLRCNCCGEVFTAPAPEGIGERKYDARAGSMIALLKYGSGLPFNRLGGLQRNLGIPLPPSTQWDIVAEVATHLDPAYRELIREAAQGKVVHNDDTSMTILELTGKRRAKLEAGPEEASGRTGVFTSGIVSTTEGKSIALFFTGRRHAGENLQELLAQRAVELGPPIQMCDALAQNTSAEFETIVANCLAHGRRRFVDVAAHFPAECRHVLETLGAVYRNDALSQQQSMSPQERLDFHQSRSRPLMEALSRWMTEQIQQRKVEPNSGLGGAIGYMQDHWKELTLFLRTPGAPLDNNLCERALKKAILHRKNALFYKTRNGARVGDLFMSLIYTCQLAGTSAFEYLTALQEHIEEVARDPRMWMPWNYRDGPGGRSKG
jgi:transposase